ncbi:MAG: transposase [Reyranellaceae bacterium]
MSRGDLSEGEWRTSQAALLKARTSRPPEDLRGTINGILWRIRAGTPWRDVPEKYGKLARSFRHATFGAHPQPVAICKQRLTRADRLPPCDSAASH